MQIETLELVSAKLNVQRALQTYLDQALGADHGLTVNLIMPMRVQVTGLGEVACEATALEALNRMDVEFRRELIARQKGLH